MAIYFCRASHGKVGSATPHYDYIHALNSYAYKKNEVVYSANFLPPWAENGREFFKMSDDYERANGMAYKEIKLTLPHEFSLKENIKLLNEFIENELGKQYYYSVVIHDKESNTKDINNIHAHLMFSTRELDGIERKGKHFFKQAYTKKPELGGNPKNIKWDSKNKVTLQDLRFSWEHTLNKHLERKKIELVSCLSIAEQYTKALQNGDLEKAKRFNRKAVNLDMKTFQKAKTGKPLTHKEQKKFTKFVKRCAIKTRLDSDYRETMASLEKRNTIKEKIVETEKKIITPKEYISDKFAGYLDIEKDILTVKKELEFVKSSSSFSAVKISAIGSLNKEYEGLHKELDKYIEDLTNITETNETDDLTRQIITEKIEVLQKRIDNIYNSLDPVNIGIAIQERIEFLEKKHAELTEKSETLSKQRAKLYKNPIMSKFELDKLVSSNQFGSILGTVVDLEWQLKNLNRDLNQTQKKLDPKELKETAKDIFTKGKYKKAKEDTEKCIDKINMIVREINGGMYDNRQDLLKEKIAENDFLRKELERLQSIRIDSFTGDNHFKVEKIENSLKEKLENRKNDLFIKRALIEQELKYYNLYLTSDGKNLDDVYVSKATQYSNEAKNAPYKEYIYTEARNVLREAFSMPNMKKLAYNKISKGTYNKIIKEYDNLETQLKQLEEQKESLSSFNPKNISIALEMKKISKEMEQLQTKYFNMINAIPEKELNEVIRELDKTRIKADKIIKDKYQEAKSSKFENNFKKNRVYEIKKELKPQTFENFKQKAKALHNQQDIGHSKCLFDDEDNLKNMSKYYLEKSHNEKDLEHDLGF